MIIELVGLPGAGKSTFARKLAQDGRWQVVRTNGALDILWNNLLFFLRHPIFFMRGLVLVVRYAGAPVFWYTKFVNLFLVHNAKYMKASRLSRAVIDQGHHQNIISLLDKKISEEAIMAFYKGLPQPDVLMFFEASKEKRAERLRARGYGVREGALASDREAWEEARERNFETLRTHHSVLPMTTMVVTPENEEGVLKKLAPIQLWRFVMHLRMPTEKAHGLQIANTLQALVRAGEFVELWVARRKNPIQADVFAYYGLDVRFPVRQLFVLPALRLVPILGAVAYWLDAAFFLLTLLLARIDKEVLYYTRNAEVAWLLGGKGARVYYEAHLWPGSKGGIFRKLLGGAKGIIANSEGTAAAFRAHGFTNVEVVRNGADLEKFASALSRENARKQVSLPQDGKILMYVGSFARWKGVVTLCLAWNKIREQTPSIRLVMVGGTKEELLRFPECKDAATDEHCIIIPHQSAEAIPAYLRAADILLLPNDPVSDESIRYTSPIKLFEYMASGRPIMASGLPSVREILNDKNATLFIPGDHEDLAKKLSQLLAEPSEGESRAGVASEEVKKYSWAKRAEHLQKFVDGNA